MKMCLTDVPLKVIAKLQNIVTKTCLIVETTSRQHLFLKCLANAIASLPYCIVVIDDMSLALSALSLPALSSNRKPARPRHTSFLKLMLARALSSGMTQSICPLIAARNNGGNIVYKHTMILTHSTGALASLVWHSLRFWG